MRRKLFIIISGLLFLVSIRLNGQNEICPKMLLSDINIQIESTEAVNQMYNFKFDKAEKKFLELKKRYPNHPLAYFLMGLSNWWKMLPNTDIREYDKTFLAYIDTSLALCDEMLKENPNNLEASFFAAAAYGLKGEYYGTHGMYTKAAWATKNALSNLSETSEKSELSPEFLYGDAVLNYYRPWLKEEYPLLYPFLIFFPSGDKELGISQLKEVTYNAFYTRTEAQYQLLRIYDNEDNYPRGYPVAQYLATTYPDNSYFLRQYAKFSWFVNRYPEAKKACYDIIYKLDNHYPGFEETAGRYAGYILGDIYRKQNQPDSAQKYFEKAVMYSERAGQTDQGYYLYSLDGLAQIAENKGDRETALKYYKTLAYHGRKKKRSYGVVRDSKDKIKELKKAPKK